MKHPNKFQPGDRIFAKVKGFVYWPARVNPLPDDVNIPNNKIPIFFFGTHEVYFISPSSCWPYDEKTKGKWGKPRSRAHFNQGMDEIENNPTLYQYGVDVLAEDFLAQFYDFKRDVKDNCLEVKVKVERARNKSTSSTATKESRRSVRDTESKESYSSQKRCKSGSSVVSKDKDSQIEKLVAKKKIEKSELSVISNTILPEESDPLIKAKSDIAGSLEISANNVIEEKLRSRSTSQPAAPKSVKSKSCHIEFDKDSISSESVQSDSDNSADEDFRPTLKVRGVNKQSTVKKSIRGKRSATDNKPSSGVSTIENVENADTLVIKHPKRMSRQSRSRKSDNKNNDDPKLLTAKRVSKSKPTAKIEVCDDSLSSISSDNDSDNDWKIKNEEWMKQHDEMKREEENEKIKKEEEAIREAARCSRQKKKLESVVSPVKVESSMKKENMDQYENNEQPDLIVQHDDSLENMVGKLDKEIVVKLTKTEILGDLPGSIETVEQSTLPKPDESEKENVVITNNENSIEKQLPLGNMKAEISVPDEMNLSRPESSSDVEIFDVDVSNKHPVNLKVNKMKSVATKQQKITINLTDDDENDHEHNLVNKKSKITLKKNSNRKRSRKLSPSSSESDDIVKPVLKKMKSSSKSKQLKVADQISTPKSKVPLNEKEMNRKLDILRNCSVEIRSSLRQDHEDFDKCLQKFYSLKDMEIDILLLVKVWQLVETVKKCRRYKKNEKVKNEAQFIYNKFMTIYHNASPEELNVAQTLLADYRQQNNVFMKNVSDRVDNGGIQNPVPMSVADMFQNKQSIRVNHDKGTDKEPDEAMNVDVTTEAVESQKIVELPKVVDEEQKMKELSADLEAKVNDILNKIEKNVPINQKSLSHLLPSESTTITLPSEWQSVSDHHTPKDVEIDSDEDDDVEAIVRKIEEVPIKASDFEDVDSAHEVVQSTLDARIENLIHSSMIVKEHRHKRSKGHRSHKDHKSNSPISPKQSPIPTDNVSVPHTTVNQDGSTTVTETAVPVGYRRNNETEIYDLLGV